MLQFKYQLIILKTLILAISWAHTQIIIDQFIDIVWLIIQAFLDKRIYYLLSNKIAEIISMINRKVDTKTIESEIVQIKLNAQDLYVYSRQQNTLLKQLQPLMDNKQQNKEEIFNNRRKLVQIRQKRYNSSKKLIGHLQMIIKKIEEYSIPFIIYLVGVGIFAKLSEQIFDLLKEYEGEQDYQFNQNQKEIWQEKKQEIQSIKKLFVQVIRKIKLNTNNFLQVFCKQEIRQLSKILEIQIQEQMSQIKQSKGQNSLQQILKNFIDFYLFQKKSSKAINQILDQIAKYEINIKSNELYEQIGLNWLKYQLQTLKKDKQYLCCKNIFFYQQTFECTKRKYFDFKKFNISKNSSKTQQQHEQLAKSITALMNQKGGAVFLGIAFQKQSNLCNVSGIQLEERHKKQVMKFIKNSVNQVHPKHKGFQQRTQQTSQILGHGNTYEINYYISVQFINVVKRATFQHYRGSNNKLYICKIVVKIGHPRYLYYILKNEGHAKEDKKDAQIQFYVKEEEQISKQNLQKCYETIYKKLIEYKNIKVSQKVGQRPQIHQGCKYDMNIKTQMLILDEPDSSDESDSDI